MGRIRPPPNGVFHARRFLDVSHASRVAVPLMNFSGKPITELTVTLHGLTKAVRVRSVERGRLQPEFRDGNMIVALPLNVTDMLLIDR